MKSLFSLILTAFFFQLSANTPHIFTQKHYNTKDGLSNNEVLAIHKDQRGFMWFGTRMGLNRFDGQNFKRYAKKNNPSLISDKIDFIAEDSDGNLWLFHFEDNYQIGFTNPKITLFNIHSGKWSTPEKMFGKKLPFQSENVRSCSQLNDRTLFFQTTDGKNFLFQNSEFQPFELPFPIFQIHGISELKTGSLLVSYQKTESEKTLQIAEVNKSGRLIARSLEEMKFDFWASILPVKINPKSNDYEVYISEKIGENTYRISVLNPRKQFEKTEEFFLSGGWLVHSEINENKIWFWFQNIDNQIIIKNKKNELIHKTDNVLYNPNRSRYFRDGNIVWMSDGKNGVNSFQFQPNHFQTVLLDNLPNQKQLKGSLRGIQKDQNGEVWISTTGTDVRLKEGQTLFTKNNRISTDFTSDNEGNIWSIFEKSLKKYNPKNGEITFFECPTNPQDWLLFCDKKGQIWSQSNEGFMILNPKKGNFRMIELDEKEFSIYDIQYRTDSEFWLCTSQGLMVFDIEKEEITSVYNNKNVGKFFIPALAVHHIYQDKKEGVIWLATGDGGLVFSRQLAVGSRQSEGEENFRQFTVSEGLSSNALHSVYEDDFGYLWLSSDRGLMQFDKETERVRAFFESDGVVNNEFNRISHFQAADGTLYFGGMKGLTYFHPRDFVWRNDEGGRIELAGFQKYSNERHEFLDWTSELAQSGVIHLSDEEPFFKMGLAFLDYEKSENVRFGYQIGNTKEWQFEEGNQLIIKNLQYGKHPIKIKAFEGNHPISENELTYSVQVLKPFYLQSWFLFLSVSLFGFGFAFRKKIRKKEAKRVDLKPKNPIPKPEKIPSLKPENKIISFPKESVNVPSSTVQKDWLSKVEIIAKREIKNKNFTVENLAFELLLSSRQMSRKMKELTGLTPNRFIRTIRLETARNLLENQKVQSLKEVTYAVGFENVTYFSRHFKAQYGQHPSEFLN